MAIADLGLQPVGQGVYNGRANAVQAAGYLVARAVELAACVQDGEYNLERWDAHLRMDAAGNAAAVVGNADDVTLFDRDLDVRAVACQCLVD